MTKQYETYRTSKHEVFYCTSHAVAQSFIKNHLAGTETATWDGSQFVNPSRLVRIARGVYKKEN